MNLNLKDKVYVIAGSSRGIGLGIAKKFLEEGASVSITGRNKESLNNAYNGLSENFGVHKILASVVDMQDSTCIKNQLQKTQEKFGHIDGVIANIGSGAEPMGLNDPDVWQLSYDKNVKASMMLVQQAIPFLENRKGSSIIFISSIAGIEDIKAPIAYSMHKAAIIAACKKLSRSLAPKHIRVNVIAPGNIFFSGGAWEDKKKKSSDEVMEYINSEVPLDSFGSPEDVGNICVFLSSEKAKFITGSLLVVDGGQTRGF